MPDRKIDPRVYEIMELLASKDLRIGQMFDNIFATIRDRHSLDPFYMENEQFLACMDEYLSMANNGLFNNKSPLE